MKKRLILILALFLSLSAMAQESDTLRRLTVTDCIDLALQNNTILKNNQLEIEKARATKKEAQTAYLPTVTAQALAFDALNPMLSW